MTESSPRSRENFEKGLKVSTEVTIERYRMRNLWTRFGEGVSRLFSPVL
jgi:hypothetical protein